MGWRGGGGGGGEAGGGGGVRGGNKLNKTTDILERQMLH